jgi:hypothetical protein
MPAGDDEELARALAHQVPARDFFVDNPLALLLLLLYYSRA